MNDQELFKKFEKYFTDKGWTFDVAAKSIAVSRTTLFNWKNGKPISKRGRMAMLALIADFNKKTVESQSPEADRQPPLDGLFAELTRLWERLSTPDRGRVITFVAELLEKSGYGTQPEGMGGDCPQSKAN